MHTDRSCARWIPRRRFRLYSYLSTPFMCPPLDQPGAIVWDGQLEIFWAATVRGIESPFTRRADYLISHPVILGLTTTVPTVTAASAKTSIAKSWHLCLAEKAKSSRSSRRTIFSRTATLSFAVGWFSWARSATFPQR